MRLPWRNKKPRPWRYGDVVVRGVPVRTWGTQRLMVVDVEPDGPLRLFTGIILEWKPEPGHERLKMVGRLHPGLVVRQFRLEEEE